MNTMLPNEHFPFTYGTALLNQEGFDVHGHDYSELVIITSGRGLHSAEDVTYSVKGGDIFILHKGMKHGFSQCRNLVMYNIGFQPDFPTEDIFDSVRGVKALFELEPQLRIRGEYKSRFHASPVQMEEIRSVLNRMTREMEEKKEGYALLFNNLFINLVILLGRFYNDSTYSPIIKTIKLSSSISQLEENFDKPFDVRTLSEQQGFSPAHFIRSFKKIYGITPLQYVLQLRIDKAMSLLRKDDFNISEIAYSCGFEDSNYFSRLFRSKVGIPPLQYRKKINWKGPVI